MRRYARPPSTAHVPARVDFCEPLGSHVLVNALVEQPGDERARIIVAASPETLPETGARVGLKLASQKIHLFDAETGSAQLTREHISLT